MTQRGPDIEEIQTLHAELAGKIWRTPVLRCPAIEASLGNGAIVYGKLEFLQRTGTFKARGALATLMGLSHEQRARGITAVSAGNHAIAVAFAARETGSTAKVVMTASANAARVDNCRALGAEVLIADDVHSAFEQVEQIQDEEGRFFVHPFEGPSIACGTGTLGVEIVAQVEEFDTLLVPVGGGGLIGGVANAVKQLRPEVRILGIEPEGADSMHRSFASGSPEAIDSVQTIADSLGAPFAMPYSFELTRNNVDRLVMINDDALRRSMGFLFSHMKLALEPACAATTAAALGPLRDELAGKRAVLVFCGSNIDWATFHSQAIIDDVS